jgi:hypothetical protein
MFRKTNAYHRPLFSESPRSRKARIAKRDNFFSKHA